MPTYKDISKNFNTEDGAFVRSKTGSFHSRQASVLAFDVLIIRYQKGYSVTVLWTVDFYLKLIFINFCHVLSSRFDVLIIRYLKGYSVTPLGTEDIFFERFFIFNFRLVRTSLAFIFRHEKKTRVLPSALCVNLFILYNIII